MHTSKRGAIIIAICCAVIVGTYFFYQKKHTETPVQSNQNSPVMVQVGIGTTTIDVVMSTSSSE